MRNLVGVFFLALALVATCCCHGYSIPKLSDLAPSIYKNQLNYRVAVGDKASPFQMKDLHVELSGNLKAKKPSSTGIHDATLLQNPAFVNDQGEQSVALQKGGWELQWQQQSPHGFLVCSFVAPAEIQRNDDAKLEAGRFFMYHRVWTTATLASERERRKEIQSEAARAIDERDQKIKEITDDESNLGSKVVSYAKAAKSMNEFRTSGYEEAKYIPLFDHQTLELTSECIVSSRGLIYKAGPNRQHQYIGESRVEFLKGTEEGE